MPLRPIAAPTIPKIIASFINGFRINLLFAPTNCIVLIMNRLEKILSLIELLIKTIATIKNKTRKS